MNPVENSKIVILVPPETKNNGAFTTNNYVDVSGFSDALFLFAMGTTDVIVGSTDTSTPPLIEECDTTDGSYTAVTDAELSAVIGAGDDDKLFGIFVDLRKTHKKYMRVQAPTAGDSTSAAMCILCILSSPAKTPETDAAAGFEERIFA